MYISGLFILKTHDFCLSKITWDGRTDRPTDIRTDGRTDTTSYRDAWSHLKTGAQIIGDANNTEYGTVQTRNSASKKTSEFHT